MLLIAAIVDLLFLIPETVYPFQPDYHCWSTNVSPMKRTDARMQEVEPCREQLPMDARSDNVHGWTECRESAWMHVAITEPDHAPLHKKDGNDQCV